MVDSVFLTYNAALSGDGLGAQAQRIMGIYAASQVLGVGYVHTPIKQIELNPGDPYKTVEERNWYLREVNRIFKLPSTSDRVPSWQIRLTGLSAWNVATIEWIARAYRRPKRPILVSLENSLPWSDRHPNAYGVAATHVSPRISRDPCDEVFRVDVHIRRALAPKFGRNGLPYDRHVPTTWYRSVLEIICQVLSNRGITPRIRIHTDIPREHWEAPPDTTSETLAMWKHHGLLDSNGFLVDCGENLAQSFGDFPHVELAQDWEPLDAMRSMVTADILIICASSFSYVSGLLRGKKLTITPRFFHKPPTSWLTVPPHLSSSQRASLRSAIDVSV